MYINAEECVDCGACRLLCEVDAIYHEDDLRRASASSSPITPPSSPRPCPAAAPAGDAGSATDLGPVGVDTPMVAGLPRK